MTWICCWKDSAASTISQKLAPRGGCERCPHRQVGYKWRLNVSRIRGALPDDNRNNYRVENGPRNFSYPPEPRRRGCRGP